jgi:thiamine transport system permease protein
MRGSTPRHVNTETSNARHVFTLKLGPMAALAVGLPAIIALIGLTIAGGGLDTAALKHAHVQRVVIFSAVQAFLSTAIALVAGAALALALARRTAFTGRAPLIALLSTATVLPGIVVVFAIVALYGRTGYVTGAARALGFEWGSWLYGLPGILIAHSFQNIPFAARLYLHALERTPPEHHRLAASLGMSPFAIFRHLDWPRLKAESAGLAALIFLLCFISFAVVLALGGGPGRATLEVAIYDALRGEADFSRAATLALLQVAIGLGLTLVLAWRTAPIAEEAGTRYTLIRADQTSLSLRAWDIAVLMAACLFIVPPIFSLMTGAFSLATLFSSDMLQAFMTSLALAAGAAFIATLLGYAMARGAIDGKRAIYSGLAYATLAMPPFAMVAGLYFALRPVANVMALGGPLIIFINALMALPFAYRLIETPLAIAHLRHGRLAQSLGMNARDRFRFVEWPLLKRPLFTAAALAAALSLGDFGVIAFFGGSDFVTLPLMLYQQLGAYRMDEAAATAFLLACLVFTFALGALRDSSHAHR